MDYLKEIMKLVEKHQDEARSCCPEDCWCWDVDAAICKYEALSGKDMRDEIKRRS